MLFFLLVMAAVVFAEERIRMYIRSAPPENTARSFWNDRVRIEHVENTGFSASRLQDRPEVVQAVSAAATAVSFLTALPELFRRKKNAGFLLGAGLLFGGSLACVGQHQKAVFIRDHITALLQKTNSPADTGFGISHMLRYIDAANMAALFRQYVDGFQIHFTGFLQMHGAHPLSMIV